MKVRVTKLGRRLELIVELFSLNFSLVLMNRRLVFVKNGQQLIA
jgi:hypothetical protein